MLVTFALLVRQTNTSLQLAESEFAAQARLAATEVSRNIQTGARGATDSLARFVEGPESSQHRSTSQARGFEPERKDFWDDFSAVGEERVRKANATPTSATLSGSIGTAAMKKNASGTGTGTGTGAKGKEDWDDNW